MSSQEYLSFKPEDAFDPHVFAHGLEQMVKSGRPVLFLCIGTDCSTGDSLGPLIGHQISTMNRSSVSVLGTLEHPVTAANLCAVLEDVDRLFPRPCIVAIDAALGPSEHIGQITLSKKPLRPGLGVKKSLPAVGEISITGIIGAFSAHDYSSIQSIRLSLIMNMAERISAGIRTYCFEHYPPHR